VVFGCFIKGASGLGGASGGLTEQVTRDETQRTVTLHSISAPQQVGSFSLTQMSRTLADAG